ncbi:MAG: hypothetical protein AMXMBFR44_5600 [Candidatus Campbellbacteria bacterium]
MKSYIRFSALVLLILPFIPSSALGAPTLSSIPDAVKSKYSFDGPIHSMVTDGTTLYLGGEFTTVSTVVGDPVSVTRNNIAVIDLATYELSDIDPDADGAVYALALSSDGTTLYLGGEFFCVGGVDELFNCIGDERSNIAAINTTTGDATAFDPIIESGVYALDLTSDDSILYVGGDFTDVNSGTTRNYLAAFTTTDGVATDFDPNPDNTVDAIVLSNDDATLYVGGSFGTIGGAVLHENLAAIDTASGEVSLDFDIATLDVPSDFKLSADDGTLYVAAGGDIRILSGRGASFEEETQEAVRPSTRVNGGNVLTVISDRQGGWYIGGNFTHVGTTSQPSIAHVTSAGTLDFDFNPDIDNGLVTSLALSPDGTTVYAGGSFNAVDNGTTRNYVAAFSAADGSTTAFDPSAGATVHALALSSDGGTLYLGGEFGAVNGGGALRNYVAAVDTTTSLATAFDPDADAQVLALALLEGDGTLFMAGDFTSLDGGATVRNRIAAFDTAGAGTVTAFNPDADNTVLDLEFGPGETTIYAGGSFANIGGGARNEFAELDVTTGSSTPLDGQVISGGGSTVYAVALSSDENTIYLGGSFSDVGGQSQSFFGEIDATTGVATDFDPGFNLRVNAIAVSTTTTQVFIGGNFWNHSRQTAPGDPIAIDVSDAAFVDAFEATFNDASIALSLTSDDELLYVGTEGVVSGLETADGDATAFLDEDIFFGSVLALKPDDSELYVASYDQDDTGETELLVFDAGDEGGDDEEEEEEEGGGGSGGSSSHRRPGSSQTNIIFILLSRLQELLREIVALGGTVPPEALQYLNMPISRTDIYLRNLTVGDDGGDVLALQNFLIAQNKGPAAQALAAHGATGYFGPLTRAALAEYQAALKIDPAVGYFGPITRGVIAGQ